MDDCVRILLVGDSFVGKTSLVLTLVSEEFPEEVPYRVEEITIPAEVTPERVPTQIVDYSSREQSLEELFDEIRRASVICVVYSADSDESLDRIRSYWLPTIRQANAAVSNIENGESKPVLLVGNKVDLVEFSMLTAAQRIMDEFDEVETCIECSAKTLRNVSEVFFYAQKAVLYPTSPLYDAHAKQLTHAAKRALTRVFRVCDADGDQALSDTELRTFQQRCFAAPLDRAALDEVKSLIRRTVSDGLIHAYASDGEADTTGNGDSRDAQTAITLKGFLCLHMLIIQRGRHETTWSVLRRFGYDNRLQLRSSYCTIPDFRLPFSCTVELSERAVHFLVKLFEKHDTDHDGRLNYSELSAVFGTMCASVPFRSASELVTLLPTAIGGAPVTQRAFIAFWTFLTYFDAPRAIEYLAALGYPFFHDNLRSAITITREKLHDVELRHTARTVFYVRVFGARRVGKSAFLAGLLNRSLQQHLAVRDSPFTSGRVSSAASLRQSEGLLASAGAAGSMSYERLMRECAVSDVHLYGQSRHLILHEMSAEYVESITPETDLDCDAACFLYDSTDPDSFEYCAQLYLHYFKSFTTWNVPVVFVRTKCDQPAVTQEYPLEPAEFCAKYNVFSHLQFTSLDLTQGDAYQTVLKAANYPFLRGLLPLATPNLAWKLSAASALIAGVGLLAYRLLRK